MFAGTFQQLVLRFSGFSLIGAANTVLSLILIFLMNEILHINYLFSYCTACIVTVFLAYVANAKLVFHKDLAAGDGLRFFAAYLSGMIIGAILLFLLKKIFPAWNATWLSYAVVFITMIWNFFFVNKILTRKEVKDDE